MGKIWAALENGKAAAPLRVSIILVGSMLTVFVGYVGWTGITALDVIKDKFSCIENKIDYLGRNMVTKGEFQYHTQYIFPKIERFQKHIIEDESRWKIYKIEDKIVR